MSLLVKARESKFELMRILAMFAIILHHLNVHSVWTPNTDPNSFFNVNYYLANIFSFGAVANVVFVILTGYFMIKTEPSAKKIVKLILQMYFYSILSVVIVTFLSNHQFTKNEIIGSLLPYPCGDNWFCVAYITLFIFMRFINKFINSLSKNEHRALLISLIIITSILPTFVNAPFFSNLDLFVLGYLIGAYIRLYVDKKQNNKKTILILFLTFIVTIVAVTLRYIWDMNKGLSIDITRTASYILDNKSIFVIVMATLIFIIFRNSTIKNNKSINRIAKSTIGIYLIHDNLLVRRYLWEKVAVLNINILHPISFIIFAILITMAIYVVCLVIDQIRIILFEKIEDKISERVSDIYLKTKLRLGL